jgi:hypothetical protein
MSGFRNRAFTITTDAFIGAHRRPAKERTVADEPKTAF